MLPVLACAYFTATVKGESKAMDEYIDRTALGIGYADPKLFDNPAYANGWNSAIKIINEAPAADVAPVVHGRWLKAPYKYLVGTCSVCGCEPLMPSFRATPYNYCPNCGAKMDEEAVK